MLVIFVVAGIGVWELLKKAWQKWNPEEHESKEARRLRKLQAAVRDELQDLGLAASSSTRPVLPEQGERRGPGRAASPPTMQARTWLRV